MRKWLVLLILGWGLVFPLGAAAQEQVRLASLEVKLWPEYDQPGMLVIYDFQVAQGVSLPARVIFRIPKDATVNAVAALESNGFVNSSYEGPTAEGDSQLLTVIVDAPTAHRLEYYEPLKTSGKARQFTYLWQGEYAVDAFSVSVQQPLDTTTFTTDPAYPAVQGSDGLTYFNSQVTRMDAAGSFKLTLRYEKTSDRLTVPTAQIQPSAPLDENTTGRVSLNNYIPYIVGAVGVTLVVAGLGYYFLWGRPREVERRQRRRAHARQQESATSEVYCHQCGQRARPTDRFCRVCGARLRQQEN
ncbi:MAG: zinc ribbon domain-containing protein [Bacteroidota bacterium]